MKYKKLRNIIKNERGQEEWLDDRVTVTMNLQDFNKFDGWESTENKQITNNIKKKYETKVNKFLTKLIQFLLFLFVRKLYYFFLKWSHDIQERKNNLLVGVSQNKRI